MRYKCSQQLFEHAKKLMPGGVSSPVRAFRSVDHVPPFIKKANGSKLWDVDNNNYIDYVGSWGTAILGHAHEQVVYAVQKAATLGLSFGACTPDEARLAEYICNALPSIQQLRFVTSGTEACMTAIRLARSYTKRDLIIKFSGHYHGHSDMLLVKGGSGLATYGLPDSAGVPSRTTECTLSIPFNDLSYLEQTFLKYKSRIAGIILEPIAGNGGFIEPKAGFLELIRDLCTQHQAVLIFDEVMTGFRVCWGGAQVLYDINPDLTTLGKVIGGGLPLAAVGGSHDIMQQLAPTGPVYQAGTLSGNPLALASGLKTLELLSNPDQYKKLNQLSTRLTTGMKKLSQKHDIPIHANAQGGMFGFFFTPNTIHCFEELKQESNVELFCKFYQKMLAKGIYFPPSLYEANFISLAHTTEDVDFTLKAIEDVLIDLYHKM